MDLKNNKLKYLYIFLLILFMPLEFGGLHIIIKHFMGNNFIFAFSMLTIFVYIMIFAIFIMAFYNIFKIIKEKGNSYEQTFIFNWATLLYYLVFIIIARIYAGILYINQGLMFFMKYPVINNILRLNFAVLFMAYIFDYAVNIKFLIENYRSNNLNKYQALIFVLLDLVPILNFYPAVYIKKKKDNQTCRN